MHDFAGLHSLALAFPRLIRTNDYWRREHPELVAAAAEKSLAKIWSQREREQPESNFLAQMAPYLEDPFRGAISRRLLAPDESALSLEARAASEALAAAGLGPDDLDLAIVSSFLPDQIGVGNAAFLARELGLRCPAWNLESACSAALVALEVAASLVRSGAHRTILVVISCTYSRVAPETDTLAWANGDGAAAFIVGPVAAGEGLLASKTINTAEGCGAMYYEIDAREDGPRVRMRSGANAGAMLREVSDRGLRECCAGAAAKAGVSLADIDFFAMPAPMAWYAAYCASELGIPRTKLVNTHPIFANTGPVLTPTSLFYAARTGRIKPGDLVMLYTVGIVSTASAAVLRWGEVGLGPTPVELDIDPQTGDASPKSSAPRSTWAF